MSMGRNMEQGPSSGQITRSILVSSITITSTGKGFTHGVMAGDMKVSGRTTRCMGKEPLLGPTAESMLESTLMIKSKAMGSLSGLMEDHIRETGIMENNMAKVSMLLHRELRSMESGKRAKGSDGLEEMIMND